jgi:hypothetical protein
MDGIRALNERHQQHDSRENGSDEESVSVAIDSVEGSAKEVLT